MTKKKTPRELAYEALLAVERDGGQSHIVIQKYLPQLPERDRAFFLRAPELAGMTDGGDDFTLRGVELLFS